MHLRIRNTRAVYWLLPCSLVSLFLPPLLFAPEGANAQVPAPPTVNKDVQRPPAITREQALTTDEIRRTIKEAELDYSAYMEILKQHREQAADWKVVRRQSNARVRTTLRSQNTEWSGTYDCDDSNASVKPGQVEVCDGIDNNCDGDIDEGVTADLFLDADGDGWGDPRQPIKACRIEAGYAARGLDCNDRNVQVHPGAADEPGDGIDANCDGEDG